jgi:hypothetical protein
MLQGLGNGAGKEAKRAGRSPSVLPFGSPPRLRSPRGACIEEAEELGLMLTLRYGVTLRAEGFTHAKGE